MIYKSPKKILLFWLFTVAIFLFFWLGWLAIECYFLSKDPLSHLPQDKAVTMAIVVGVLLIDLLIGLILSAMLENRRYLKCFSVFIGVLLFSLLLVRSITG